MQLCTCTYAYICMYKLSDLCMYRAIEATYQIARAVVHYECIYVLTRGVFTFRMHVLCLQDVNTEMQLHTCIFLKTTDEHIARLVNNSCNRPVI